MRPASNRSERGPGSISVLPTNWPRLTLARARLDRRQPVGPEAATAADIRVPAALRRTRRRQTGLFPRHRLRRRHDAEKGEPRTNQGAAGNSQLDRGAFRESGRFAADVLGLLLADQHREKRVVAYALQRRS